MTAPFQDALDRITHISSKYALLTLEPQINACRELLSKQGSHIDVGVFGRFKAGKSSFLNSLAGETILPVGVIPVTAVITRLRYAPALQVSVLFLNGSTAKIQLSDLPDYVSEDKNPKNQKEVASVEIEHPSLKSYEGLQFVDTPGLGSVFKHNTTAALDWLPYVGIAIVAIGVDSPLSEQDITLLREVMRYTPKVALLLTKADLISEQELSQVKTFVARESNRELGRELSLHPYSIREEQSNLRIALDKALLQPLQERVRETQQEVLNHKLNSLSLQVREYLGIAVAAAKKADSERAHLREQIFSERAAWNTTQEEIRITIRDQLGKTRPFLVSTFAPSQAVLIQELRQQLQARIQPLGPTLWHVHRGYEDWVYDAFRERIGLLSAHERPQILRPIQQAQERLGRVVRAFQDRLSGSLMEAIGVPLSATAFEFRIRDPENPDISIGSAFDFKLDLVWFLFPVAIFRRWIDRRFLGLIPYEVEKNISRLASQWTDRINSVISDLGTQAERYVRNELSSIETLLGQTHTTREEIESDLGLFT
jgi:ribosome biogenesis GTPase A